MVVGVVDRVGGIGPGQDGAVLLSVGFVAGVGRDREVAHLVDENALRENSNVLARASLVMADRGRRADEAYKEDRGHRSEEAQGGLLYNQVQSTTPILTGLESVPVISDRVQKSLQRKTT